MALAVGARARTLRSWARGSFIAPLFGFVAFVASALLLGAAPAGAAQLDEILTNVRAATQPVPARVAFRQDVELRVFLFRWSFHADVVRDETGISVEVHGAPKFLSPDISVSLLELSEGLDGFDLELVEQSERRGEPVYVLRGTAREGADGGARGGTITVNGRSWLIEQAELQYPWGAMTVEQTFQRVDGFTLLKEQHATVDVLGAKLRVHYGGYSLE